MEIKIIIAPEGSGKTQYILNEFLKNPYESMVLTKHHKHFTSLISPQYVKYKKNVFVYTSKKIVGRIFKNCFCDDYFLTTEKEREEFLQYLHPLGIKNILVVSSTKNPLLKSANAIEEIRHIVKGRQDIKTINHGLILNEVLYDVPSSFIRYKKDHINYVNDLKDAMYSFAAIYDCEIIHKESLKN